MTRVTSGTETAAIRKTAAIRSTATTSTTTLGASPTVELVAAAQKGDQAAKERLVVKALPRFKSWAHGRLPALARGHQDTQDLAQDAVLQLLRQLRHFTPRHEQAVLGYLRMTAQNRVLDEVRRAGRRPIPVELDEALPLQRPDPLTDLVRVSERQRVRRAIGQLRPKDRKIITRSANGSCRLAELAKLMGLPSAAAAGMALRRAELRLQAQLDQ